MLPISPNQGTSRPYPRSLPFLYTSLIAVVGKGKLGAFFGSFEVEVVYVGRQILLLSSTTLAADAS